MTKEIKAHSQFKDMFFEVRELDNGSFQLVYTRDSDGFDHGDIWECRSEDEINAIIQAYVDGKPVLDVYHEWHPELAKKWEDTLMASLCGMESFNKTRNKQ